MSPSAPPPAPHADAPDRPLRIGDRVPLPPRKLDIRPNGPIDNRPSFRPARNGR